jgi:hypothetical protein
MMPIGASASSTTASAYRSGMAENASYARRVVVSAVRAATAVAKPARVASGSLSCGVPARSVVTGPVDMCTQFLFGRMAAV